MKPAPLAAILALVVTLLAGPALAERLVSEISNTSVEITSSFDGERLTFFGTIVPDIGALDPAVTGPFHVVIVVSGPTQHPVLRKKTNSWGIWLNTDQVAYRDFPSYLRVLSSGRLSEIAAGDVLLENAIMPEAHLHPASPVSQQKSLTFGEELLRQMAAANLFGVQENGVSFLSETLYSARLTLPANAPPGPYIAQTYLLKDGAIIARQSEGFAVRKMGFERFLALSSVQFPMLYGLACVVLALFTGWLGGVVFKR